MDAPYTQRPADDRTNLQIGVIVSIIVVVVLSLWNASSLLKDSNVKYVLYGLPPLILVVFALALRGRLAVERSGFYAFLIYASVASLALLSGRSMGWFAVRDLFIVLSYSALFVLYFRAPRLVADALLVFCVIGTVTVIAIKGVSIDTGVVNPSGQQLLESVVSFPAGIVFLYYLGERKWGRALIALMLFVLAFKRIAFLGVGLALCVEFGAYLMFRRSLGWLIPIVVVVALSIVALFSLQIFQFIAAFVGGESVSANSISLGRAHIATELWRQIQTAGIWDRLTGFGPGAADQALIDAGLNLNPHNDWLKILFDYGVIGFVGMHAMLRLIHPNTPLGNKLYIYLAALMVTGNPLIYTYYFVSLFLVVRIPPGPSGRPESLSVARGIV